MKFAGKIGFVKTVDPEDNGNWVVEKTELPYFGDVLRNTSRWKDNSYSTNDDITINNQISVYIDPYALENFQYMKYVEWFGSLWKIESVEINHPRVLITLGGVYNG